ncbi:hypothetical protein BT63DRAFT_476864 [Microthyrium microscopicum]|uniref:NADH-ubiquinone oxidoreductase n=1 Tax=Microthyrium microscopicum TaxID=703497 RepID=A0A6A6UIL3_9PEZI|nr:hypothetical protein BT63DRAFT_476864 [Microthyrium microscopicum]
MAATQREPRLATKELFDLTPMPDHIPKVTEIGSTSGPLMSAAFFIGARCRPFNDDYMKCKEDAQGRGELECMKEGRKVTRCAQSVLKDVTTHCLEQFRSHWQCLENNNHHYYDCRAPEWALNKCVYEKLPDKLVKSIPGAPEDEVPIYLRNKHIHAKVPWSQGTPWVHPGSKWEEKEPERKPMPEKPKLEGLSYSQRFWAIRRYYLDVEATKPKKKWENPLL